MPWQQFVDQLRLHPNEWALLGVYAGRSAGTGFKNWAGADYRVVSRVSPSKNGYEIWASFQPVGGGGGS